MARDIIYIKLSGDYDHFDECKYNTKLVARHKGILKYLTEKWYILTEEDVEADKDKLKIYEVNSKTWDLLIISLTYILFKLVSQCNENSHEASKAIIDKCELLDEKQESLN